jgi:GR25 family glycosyltransferase involved in LPS biosynthesis
MWVFLSRMVNFLVGETMKIKVALVLAFIFNFNLSCFPIDLQRHLLKQETNIARFFKEMRGPHNLSNLRNVDCIYVINLDERPEKWERTKKQLSQYEIGFNRFSGINGWRMPPELLTAFWNEQGRLRANEVLDANHPYVSQGKLGCILSHLSVLQDAYDRGYQCIWILQDDIEIFRDLSSIDYYLDRLDMLDPHWGLLFTDLDMRQYDNPGKPLTPTCLTGAIRENQETMPLEWYLERKNMSEDFQEIRTRYGFHSVLISREGMEKILYYFKHVFLHTSFDIDVFFIHDLNKYGLRNPMVSNACDWKVSDSSRKYLSIQELPEPYNQLSEILPFNNHGWDSNANHMQMIVDKFQPKIVVELGSWLGKSTCHIAKLLPKDGKVYAIDHWLGSQDHQNSLTTDVQKLLPVLYEQFLSNVVHEYLTDKIIPWRMTTDEAAQKMRSEKRKIDLIYLDASHDEMSVYNDLCNWYPFVRKSGVLCGDDWSRGKGFPVRKAVKRFARENRLEIINLGSSFWYLQKNKKR